MRDVLSGNDLEDGDLDILVEGDAFKFAAIACESFGGSLKQFNRFFTAKLLKPTAFPTIEEIDFASSRTEIYESPGALPVVRLAKLADDLRRRDFSINAIALPLAVFADTLKQQIFDGDLIRSSIIDPFHGAADLNRKQIRILHERSFHDDPTRLYRALRYMVRIGGEFEASTGEAFTQATNLNYLATVSTKRLFNEVVKIVFESKAALLLQHNAMPDLLKGTFVSHHIDADKFLALLRRIFSATQKKEFASSQSVEKLLLILAFVCLPNTHREGFFQALAVPKKARADLQSGWDSLLEGNRQGVHSPEFLWVFGALNES